MFRKLDTVKTAESCRTGYLWGLVRQVAPQLRGTEEKFIGLLTSGQLANHDARLANLEQDHTERTRFAPAKKAAIGFALRCMSKITFGLIKAE